MIHINIMETIINEERIINQRDLKIEMTKKNILSLFNNNKEIADYLCKKTQTFSTGFGECVHLMIIEFLDNGKNTDMDMVYGELNVFYYKNNKIISFEYFEMIIKMIIDDYNECYLNDEFYYNGYWYDGEWTINSP
jgi:hypothetical protein